MDEAAQPKSDPEVGPLSKWWLRSVLLVMILGFAGLLAITMLSYRNAPPIPGTVIDASGETLFTGDQIRSGQAIFLRYGLMDNGTIWGHGAYLGPDFSAETLHQIGESVAASLAHQQFAKALTALSPIETGAIRGQVAVALKANRFNPASNTLSLTAPEATAYRAQTARWTSYFTNSARNGGLAPNLITDPAELRDLTAFFCWTAWASVADRPGADYSYTNNFPYDPSVGNVAPAGALLWSALSLIALLGGIATVLLAFGKFDYLGWITRGHSAAPEVIPGQASPSQRALVKFFVVVSLLFLMQTLVGGAVAHYRADPESFYGFQLETIFPSNLMRIWHLQTAIFWIATAYVAAALFLGRSLRADEPRWLPAAIHLLFAAFAIVIGASLLGEWAGISGWLGDWWFLFGNQGWEYLEIGRFWQYLLVAGLLGWFALLWWIARPSQVTNVHARPIARMFLFGALAIPVFYVPALFFGAKTNFTVVDTWRFWIIHLWVEGFFEFFATTVVALMLFQLGLTGRNTALRVIYLDAILYFLGGLMGTGHHWYFSGQTQINMAASALFSALEVVPLTLLTLDAWDFVRTTRSETDQSGVASALPHKWTFYFLMAVGLWNFLGAGVFGFMINLPIVSYYEVGTILTPNHGHAAMMGVFGMLALALMVFVLRQTTDVARWPSVERYVRIGFWGSNIGLALMVTLSLFPSGVLQVWDVLQHGYWHARSIAYTGSDIARQLEWMRLPGDLIFIIFGAIPLMIAALKAYWGLYMRPFGSLQVKLPPPDGIVRLTSQGRRDALI